MAKSIQYIRIFFPARDLQVRASILHIQNLTFKYPIAHYSITIFESEEQFEAKVIVVS